MKLNTKVKVLIVDDFSTMRRIIRALFRQLGYEQIEEAEDGARALSMVRKGEYGLIISDWNMPEMEGIDLLRRIRADERLKETPFIMVTAEADRDKIITAIKAGVDNYVVKPFTQETLKEKLEKVAGKKGSLAA